LLGHPGIQPVACTARADRAYARAVVQCVQAVVSSCRARSSRNRARRPWPPAARTDVVCPHEEVRASCCCLPEEAAPRRAPVRTRVAYGVPAGLVPLLGRQGRRGARRESAGRTCDAGGTACERGTGREHGRRRVNTDRSST
jgi:hypothetical protein